MGFRNIYRSNLIVGRFIRYTSPGYSVLQPAIKFISIRNLTTIGSPHLRNKILGE